MKPIRMTHTEASMVLSNWWRAEDRIEYRHTYFCLDEVIRKDARYHDMLGNAGVIACVGPDHVAACILVVPERRRGR